MTINENETNKENMLIFSTSRKVEENRCQCLIEDKEEGTIECQDASVL